MKQGTNFHIKVNINMDLDLIETITFLFKAKSGAELTFVYPSKTVTRVDDSNQLKIKWTREQTYMFSSNEYIMMDTFIKLVDCTDNPQTNIVKFYLNPTLFMEEDIDE